jgi:hypothetical protein
MSVEETNGCNFRARERSMSLIAAAEARCLSAW